MIIIITLFLIFLLQDRLRLLKCLQLEFECYFIIIFLIHFIMGLLRLSHRYSIFLSYLNFCYFTFHLNHQSILVQYYPTIYYLIINFHLHSYSQSILLLENISFLIICACLNNCKFFMHLLKVMVLTS